MNDEVIIITPELSPATGGVGDYTLRILESWGDFAGAKMLVAQTSATRTAPPSFQIEKLGSCASAILAQLPVTAGKVLVQYSAYGFDRLGYPRGLIRALIEWKGRTRGRLVIMFHEIWTFWPITNKNFFVQLLHRRAIKRLLGCADVVFTSTPSQAKHLSALSPDKPIHVLPVGSNIRRNEEPVLSEAQRSRRDVDLARIPGWAVLFGRQGSRIRALQKMWNSLNSLAAAGSITKIVSLGASGDSSKEERSLLAGLQLKEGFEQLGPRPEREISQLLLQASFGIFAQDELSITKSGTFMAYAAHELNVLADFAGSSKPEPICWLVAPPELLEQISQPELQTRAQRLGAWQRENASWEFIGERLAEALHLRVRQPLRAGAANS